MDPRIGFRRGENEYWLQDLRTPRPERLMLEHGAKGLGMAPVKTESSPLLGGNGSLLLGVRMEGRPIIIPAVLDAPTEADANDQRREIMDFLSPLDITGIGRAPVDPADGLQLMVESEDLGRREIGVVYTDGLDGDFGGDYTSRSQSFLLEFEAVEHLWRGRPVELSKTVAPARKPFLSTTVPFFPIVLSASTVQGEMSLLVRGDAPVFPVWTVTGPGRDLSITNPRTRERFYLEGSITSPITIDMANGDVVSREAPNGELFDRVSLDSKMMPLEPGNSMWNVALVGATEDSNISVTYTPRWLTGY